MGNYSRCGALVLLTFYFLKTKKKFTVCTFVPCELNETALVFIGAGLKDARFDKPKKHVQN